MPIFLKEEKENVKCRRLTKGFLFCFISILLGKILKEVKYHNESEQRKNLLPKAKTSNYKVSEKVLSK